MAATAGPHQRVAIAAPSRPCRCRSRPSCRRRCRRSPAWPRLAKLLGEHARRDVGALPGVKPTTSFTGFSGQLVCAAAICAASARPSASTTRNTMIIVSSVCREDSERARCLRAPSSASGALQQPLDQEHLGLVDAAELRPVVIALRRQPPGQQSHDAVAVTSSEAHRDDQTCCGTAWPPLRRRRRSRPTA